MVRNVRPIELLLITGCLPPTWLYVDMLRPGNSAFLYHLIFAQRDDRAATVVVQWRVMVSPPGVIGWQDRMNVGFASGWAW
jgi:hypothetical protein